jgi:putative endonuclease
MAKSMKTARSDRQAQNHRQGVMAEEFVVGYLQSHEYQIIERRYRCPYGEIDIIARIDSTLVFVEVKSSRRAVNKEVLAKKQMHRISNTAAYFLSENNEYISHDYDMRFDVIFCENKVWLQHIQHAWDADEIFSC